MAYRVELRPSAARELARLPRDERERVDARILSLADDPRPMGAIKLHDRSGEHRARVGDYRIVYVIDDAARLVTVTQIGNRRDVYR